MESIQIKQKIKAEIRLPESGKFEIIIGFQSVMIWDHTLNHLHNYVILKIIRWIYFSSLKVTMVFINSAQSISS